MNLSQQTIEMHFKEILALTEQLDVLAKEIGKVSQEEISGAAMDTKRRWSSACAQKLVERELRLAEQMRAEGDVLCKVAGEIKEQAEEMYRMEILNAALAAVRGY